MSTAVTEARLPFKRMMNGHIAVKIDEFKYSGRIVVPEIAKRQPTKGLVIAVADDITDVRVGDKILYSQFAGYALRFEGQVLMRVLGYSEILAILNDDSPEVVSEGA